MKTSRAEFLKRFSLVCFLVLAFVMTWFVVGTVAAQVNQPASASISLTGGGDQTCVLVDGAVRCWGFSVKSGVPGGLDHPVPVAVNTLPAGIQQIDAGNTHTCALTAASGVKCWGYNSQGQLGNGTYDYSQTPVDVTGLAGAVQSIGMGYSHSCAVINITGAVQCWGLNANGQLGNTMGGTYNTPVNVTGLSGVKKVTGGAGHTCALLNSGALKCWGYGYYGQLGNGTSGNTADTYIPQDVTGLDHGVVDMAAGYVSTCALLDSGQVKCWGLLGDIWSNTPVPVAGLESGVTALVMGNGHLCTLHGGGQVKCLGGNDSGQLGDGTNTARMAPAVVPGLESGVVSLEAGLSNNCAAFNNGQVWCWGSDGSSELGVGTTTAAIQPWPVVALSGQGMAGVAAGSNYTCAFTTSGKLYCWGLNNSGNLGTGAPDFSSYSLPQMVNGISSGASQVAAGTHTCAVVGGAAKCWGRNDVGQLGNGTQEPASTPSQVSILTSGVSKIAVTPYADQAHTCAVANGAAYCWGGNYVGQLGTGSYGETNGIHTPQAVVGLGSGVTDIGAGAYHSCAVVNGAALCWGLSYYGQVGNGDYGDYDKYPTPQAVVGLGSGVTAIVTGSQFSCAVVGGAAKCWGRNQAGQLGNGTSADASTPVQVSGLTSGVTAISAGDERACAVKDGDVYCWGGSSSNSPYKVNGISGATTVAASYGSCALNADGVSCWGNNQYGQMGDGRAYQSNRVVKVLGFGPQPELRINAAEAAAGSPLRLVGANFPANATVLLKSNGNSFCTLTTGPDGFFPAVLLTGGAPDGYYQITALVRGVEASTGFSLAAGAELLGMHGGGPTCELPGAVVPTPQPTPTVPPGTSLPAPVVQSIQPIAGDASLMGQMEIYGANFQPGAVARLGNVPAIQTTFNDSTHLTALIPGGLAAATYNITVINPDWNKGTLASAYTAMIIDPVSPGVQNDLYAQNYELSAEHLYETVNQPTTVWFSVRRLGGAAVQNNILVRFYVGQPGLTDPATQATFIGEKNLSGLASNGRLVTSVAWTPTQEGDLELYALIDPLNTIAEKDETNNLYHSWVQVHPPQVVDNTPPVVTSVSAPLVVNNPYFEMQVQASDAGGSGVAWVDVVVWEYFPSIRSWLMTDESGWQYMADGAVKHLWTNVDGFSGARYIDVWVADGQNNVSVEPYSVVVNYIEPDNFIFMGESHLFLFPMFSGDAFLAGLTNLYPQDDADLYLWPPDYPTHNYWYSAHDAGQPEGLAVTAPVTGYYWLEVYGYDFAFYNLTAGVSLNSDPLADGMVNPLKTLRVTPLASGNNLPVETYRLERFPQPIYLPLINRK